MKKILLVILLCGVIFVTGCQKNETLNNDDGVINPSNNTNNYDTSSMDFMEKYMNYQLMMIELIF